MPKVSPTEEVTTGRTGRVRRVTASISEINVVPLVDVMLVLLVIFMVTAPMLQRGIDVNLPVARRSEPIAEERVFITLPLSFRKDRTVRVGTERVRIDVLAERVRQMMDGRAERKIFLRCDGAITVQEQLEIMDRLKDAGIEQVGIVARLPEER